jgi:hypothetical protein
MLNLIIVWYSDRGGDLVDTNDVSFGNCVVDTSDDYDCYFAGAVGLPETGRSQIHCISSLKADSTD